MAYTVDELKDKFGELNIERGLIYCNDDPDFFVDMLKIYLDTEKTGTLEKALEDEDVKAYQLAVHSLKSISSQIGAMKIAEMAKDLDRAGKAADMDYIKDNHKKFMNVYAPLIDKLKEQLG